MTTSSSSSRTGSPRGTGPLALRERGELASRRLDRLVPERVHDLRPVQQATLLLRVEAVLDIAILKDIGQPTAARVFADQVGSYAVFPARTGEQKREGAAQQACQSLHRGNCILASVKRKSTEGRFAERLLAGVDDQGGDERVVIWIERKAGAL